MKKPYVLLHRPATGHAAIYDYGHRLVASAASDKLVAFALEHSVLRAQWSDKLDEHYNRPRPVWAADGDLNGCLLYWLRDGNSTDEHLLALPDR